MQSKHWSTVVVLSLALANGIQTVGAQGNGKGNGGGGGGGGRPSTNTPAEFQFPPLVDLTLPSISGDAADGSGSYMTGNGIEVFFDGVGSPHLEFDDSGARHLVLTLDRDEDLDGNGVLDCDAPAYFDGGVVATGDNFWFASVGTAEPEDPANVEFEDEFMGLSDGEVGQGQMILRFLAPDDPPDGKVYLWRMVFGGFVNVETDRVLVKRLPDDQWRVTGKYDEFRTELDGTQGGYSLGRLVRIDTSLKNNKKNRDTRTVFRGLCSVYIDFDVFRLP